MSEAVFSDEVLEEINEVLRKLVEDLNPTCAMLLTENDILIVGYAASSDTNISNSKEAFVAFLRRPREEYLKTHKFGDFSKDAIMFWFDDWDGYMLALEFDNNSKFNIGLVKVLMRRARNEVQAILERVELKAP